MQRISGGAPQGNIANQKYEAQLHIQRYLHVIENASPNKETRRWRDPPPDAVNFKKSDGKARIREREIAMDNDKLSNRIYTIMTEDRASKSTAYAPGWRIGASGIYIDCYKTDACDAVKFAELHGREHDRLRETKKINEENKKLRQNIRAVASPLAVDSMAKDYAENRYRSRMLFSRTPQTVLHLGLVTAARKTPITLNARALRDIEREMKRKQKRDGGKNGSGEGDQSLSKKSTDRPKSKGGKIVDNSRSNTASNSSSNNNNDTIIHSSISKSHRPSSASYVSSSSIQFDRSKASFGSSIRSNSNDIESDNIDKRMLPNRDNSTPSKTNQQNSIPSRPKSSGAIEKRSELRDRILSLQGRLPFPDYEFSTAFSRNNSDQGAPGSNDIYEDYGDDDDLFKGISGQGNDVTRHGGVRNKIKQDDGNIFFDYSGFLNGDEEDDDFDENDLSFLQPSKLATLSIDKESDLPIGNIEDNNKCPRESISLEHSIEKSRDKTIVDSSRDTLEPNHGRYNSDGSSSDINGNNSQNKNNRDRDNNNLKSIQGFPPAGLGHCPLRNWIISESTVVAKLDPRGRDKLLYHKSSSPCHSPSPSISQTALAQPLFFTLRISDVGLLYSPPPSLAERDEITESCDEANATSDCNPAHLMRTTNSTDWLLSTQQVDHNHSVGRNRDRNSGLSRNLFEIEEDEDSNDFQSNDSSDPRKDITTLYLKLSSDAAASAQQTKKSSSKKYQKQHKQSALKLTKCNSIVKGRQESQSQNQDQRQEPTKATSGILLHAIPSSASRALFNAITSHAVNTNTSVKLDVNADIDFAAQLFIPFRQLINLSVVAGFAQLDFLLSRMAIVHKQFELYDCLADKLTAEYEDILTKILSNSFEVIFDPSTCKSRIELKLPTMHR